MGSGNKIYRRAYGHNPTRSSLGQVKELTPEETRQAIRSRAAAKIAELEDRLTHLKRQKLFWEIQITDGPKLRAEAATKLSLAQAIHDREIARLNEAPTRLEAILASIAGIKAEKSRTELNSEDLVSKNKAVSSRLNKLTIMARQIALLRGQSEVACVKPPLTDLSDQPSAVENQVGEVSEQQAAEPTGERMGDNASGEIVEAPEPEPTTYLTSETINE